MLTTKQVVFDDFARWLIEIEREKDPTFPGGPVSTADERKDSLLKHPGICPLWIPGACWELRELTPGDLESVIVLDDGCGHMRKEGLVVNGVLRTLGNAARNAQAHGFFELRPSEWGQRFHKFYTVLSQGRLRLVGDRRIVLRELLPDFWDGEQVINELEATNGLGVLRSGALYLHDGLGRSIPFMVLVHRGIVPINTVIEAFVVTQSASARTL